MKYMGSKNRIAKHLLPIILKDRKPEQWYVEPFVGGANMIDKVDGNRIGSDLNKPLIACLDGMSKKWLPMNDISESFFNSVKADNSIVDLPTLGYIGTQLTFGSMWFSGYRKDNQGVRNYSNEAFRNIEKQAPNLYGVKFESKSYLDLDIPSESIIYCDPPYKGTAKYKAVEDFNHELFWQWCRDMSDKGHQVFISEYNAPDDFECLWQKEIQSGLNINSTKKGVEKLFKYKP
jgi:DNA adenine methylase